VWCHRVAHRLVANRAGVILACALSIGILTGCDWPWRHDMVDAPSQPGAAAPRPAVAGALPIGGVLPPPPAVADALRNPSAPATPARGSALYAIYCAPCHGPSGRGDGPVAKYDAPVGDLTTAEVQRHTDGWLYAIVVNGTGKMPRFAHELEPIERWEVVQFVRQLPRSAP
jgi:mono/diheme cytochrome c family protein